MGVFSHRYSRLLLCVRHLETLPRLPWLSSLVSAVSETSNFSTGPVALRKCRSTGMFRSITNDSNMATIIAPDYGIVFPPAYLAEGGERTFQHDDNLPPLPVPPLESTLTKYLDSVHPHLKPEEFAETEKIVKAFELGIGQQLHQKLLQKKAKNWLEVWWEDYAYLLNREPHAPYVNFTGPGIAARSYWPPKDGTQMQRAALYMWTSLRYWQLLRQEHLRIDRGEKGTVTWSMAQFRRMFNTCKIPGFKKDEIINYFKTEHEGHCPSHLVVLCKGRIFTLDSCDKDGELLTPPELQWSFENIQQLCDAAEPGKGLGSMTGEDRTTWAEVRKHLVELHPDNRRHLETIQTAIAVIVLDNQSPTDITQIAREGQIGDSANRWFDKSISFIFYRNGTLSVNCDHAPVDAMVMVSVSYWNHLVLQQCNGVWPGPSVASKLHAPSELVFYLDDFTHQAIDRARVTFASADAAIDLHIGTFGEFGKSWIRQFKLHPDTFMQLALQLTYFTLYTRPAPTYETATTRRYYHGRTETVRSCTPESLNWCLAMRNANCTNVERMRLLATAFTKHNQLMSDGMKNYGCDRHLLGMQIIAAEEGIETPEIYTDPAWKKSGGGGNFVLSTSFLGYMPIVGGVPPMCKDGYGIFYCMQPSEVYFYLSAWTHDKTTDPRMFFDSLQISLRDMRHLVETSKVAQL